MCLWEIYATSKQLLYSNFILFFEFLLRSLQYRLKFITNRGSQIYAVRKKLKVETIDKFEKVLYLIYAFSFSSQHVDPTWLLSPHIVRGMILYRILILTHFLLYTVHTHHQFHVLNVDIMCEIMDFVCMVCTSTNVREQFLNPICIVYFST